MTKSWTNRDAAVDIITRLADAGHIALLAGGCVRDMLLGRRPKDHDVATDATPDRVIELFSRTRKVGAQFGVVLVGLGRQWIEVATFRTDQNYSDGRRPDSVVFCGAREDALRRDFTVNGMFHNPLTDALEDYVGGQADLDRRVIRAIGDPEHRFAEDHLRMIRAVRFATRLEFQIDPATYRAIVGCATALPRVSIERIREEFELILISPHRARGLAMLADSGLFEQFWPGEPWPTRDVDAAAQLLSHLPATASFELALAAMASHVQPSDLHRICRELTCSNRTTEVVTWLVANLPGVREPDALELVDLKILMHHPRFEGLAALLRATLHAAREADAPYRRLRERAAAIPAESVHPEPLINGNDLMALGLTGGPLFKRVLDATYRAQLNDALHNKQAALAFATAMVRL